MYCSLTFELEITFCCSSLLRGVLSPECVLMSLKTKKLTDFFFASFVTLWACAIVYACILLGSNRTALVMQTPGQLLQADFVRYYACGKMAASCDRLKVYDQDTQRKWVNQVLAPDKQDEYPYIQYMPVIFPLFVVFALLPPLVAYNVWNLTTVGLGLVALYKLICINSDLRQRKVIVFLLLGIFSSAASEHVIRAGQINWLQMAAIAMFWVYWFERRDIAAGIAMAFTVYKPQYSFICLLPVLAYGKWKTLLSACITGLSMLAVTAALIGPENIIGYPQVLMQIEGNSQNLCVLARDMYCLRAILSWFLPLDVAFKSVVLLWSLGAVLIFFYWRSIPKESIKEERWAAACTAVWALLFSPHAHGYDLLILVLPIVLTLTSVSFYDVLKIQPLSARIYHLVFLLYPFLSWIFFIVSFSPAIGWSYVEPIGSVLFLLFVFALMIPRCLAQVGALSQHGLARERPRERVRS